MKRLLICTIVMTLILSIGLVSLAARPSVRPPEPTIGVKSSDPLRGRVDISKSESIRFQTVLGDIIQLYGCEVFTPGSGMASMTGYTDLYDVCDLVRVTIYLQRWGGSDWLDVTSTARTDYDTNYTAVGKESSSVPGYYRTRAVHYAKTGTGTEVTYSESPYIFIE